MPLFVTNRVTDFETMHNPAAVFVYFDTVKGDCFGADNTVIKSLSDNNKQQIIYRKNMSFEGAFSKEEFNTIGRNSISSNFDSLRSHIKKGRLVVFPVVPFSLAKSLSSKLASEYMDKRFMELVNTTVA
tara:strand:- start:119 stop:505 length:387 start_codon:yes stop_codon:yes gene_type:complete